MDPMPAFRNADEPGLAPIIPFPVPPVIADDVHMRLAITGVDGHAEADFTTDKIVLTFKKTTPSERGTIEKLVEKGLKKGLKLFHGKNGNADKPLDRLLDVLMNRKAQVVLTGDSKVIEELALEAVEEEVKARRLVMEAREDGTWKVVKVGDFKPKEEGKKKVVTSTAPVGGG
jgi:hypothetical protein